MLDPAIIRRLAFVKFLYSIGIEQSKAPEPFANAALLTFHDAAELFLQLSAEYLDADVKKNQDFIGYWPIISKKMAGDTSLSQQESMRRLNAARVSLKHSGTQPSTYDLESFRAAILLFFEDNVPAVFGVALTDVSLIEFVQPDGSRNRLKLADKLKLEMRFDEAALEIAIAFDEMIQDYETRKSNRSHRSPFTFGRNLRWNPSLSMMARGLNQEMTQYLDNIHVTVEAMQKALRILALGINFRRYSRFHSIVPTVHRTLSGRYHAQDRPPGSRTSDMIQFCLDFVIEAAVHLREFDYDAPYRNGAA